MSDIKISTIYDHYKDSYCIVSEAVKRRDRLMIYVLIALAFLAFQVVLPNESKIAVNNFLNFKFGFAFEFNLSVIGCLAWFLLLVFALRYFQTAVFVERQYPYIHKIEEEINKEFNNEGMITREGKSYLSDYPWFSNWMWAIYTIVFPFLSLLVITEKILGELKNAIINRWSLSFSLDVVAYIILTVSIILYLLVLHKRVK